MVIAASRGHGPPGRSWLPQGGHSRPQRSRPPREVMATTGGSQPPREVTAAPRGHSPPGRSQPSPGLRAGVQWEGVSADSGQWPTARVGSPLLGLPGVLWQPTQGAQGPQAGVGRGAARVTSSTASSSRSPGIFRASSRHAGAWGKEAGLLGQRTDGNWIQVHTLEQAEPKVGGQDRGFRSGGLCPLPSPALGAKGQRVYKQEVRWAQRARTGMVPGEGRPLVTLQ